MRTRLFFYLLVLLILVLLREALPQPLHQTQYQERSTVRTMEWKNSSAFDRALNPYILSLSLSDRWLVRCRDVKRPIDGMVIQMMDLCYAKDNTEGRANISMYVESPLLQEGLSLSWQDANTNAFLKHLGKTAIERLQSIDNKDRTYIFYKIYEISDSEIVYADKAVAQMYHYDVALFDKRNPEGSPPVHIMHVAASFFSHQVPYVTERGIIYKNLRFTLFVYNREISEEIQDDALQLMLILAPQIQVSQP